MDIGAVQPLQPLALSLFLFLFGIAQGFRHLLGLAHALTNLPPPLCLSTLRFLVGQHCLPGTFHLQIHLLRIVAGLAGSGDLLHAIIQPYHRLLLFQVTRLTVMLIERLTAPYPGAQCVDLMVVQAIHLGRRTGPAQPVGSGRHNSAATADSSYQTPSEKSRNNTHNRTSPVRSGRKERG